MERKTEPFKDKNDIYSETEKHKDTNNSNPILKEIEVFPGTGEPTKPEKIGGSTISNNKENNEVINPLKPSRSDLKTPIVSGNAYHIPIIHKVSGGTFGSLQKELRSESDGQRANRSEASRINDRNIPLEQGFTKVQNNREEAGKHDGEAEKTFGGNSSNAETSEYANRDSIDRLNAKMRTRDALEKPLNSVIHTLAKPMQELNRYAQSGDDDYAQGYKTMDDYVSVIPDVFGGYGNSADIKELAASIGKRQNYILAGDAMERLVSSGIIDKENFTTGDIAAFRAKRKNPNLSDDDLIKIKKTKDTMDGRRLLQPKKSLQKQSREIERSLRMNEAETFAETLIAKYSSLFTDSETAILKDENSLFKIKTIGDFKTRDRIIDKILHNPKLIGSELGNIDWNRMTARNISDLLKGKTGIVIKDNRIRGLLEAKLENIQSMEKLKKLQMKRASRKGLSGTVIDRVVFRQLLKDEDLSQASGLISTELTSVKYAGKVATGGTKLGYTAARGTGKIIGKGVIAGANAIGNNEVAEAVANIGKKYASIENAIGNGMSQVKNAPRRAAEKSAKIPVKMVANAGAKIASSAIYQKFSNSAFGRTTKRVFRQTHHAFKTLKAVGGKAVRIALAPLRIANTAAVFVKKKIMLPIAIGVGGLLLIEIVIVALSGGSINTSGAGAYLSVILDEDEHFADFQKKYDEQDSIFQAQVNSIINSDAQTRNLKGVRIGYGINTRAVDSPNPDLKLKAQYQNGLHLGYYYDGQPATGISSNIEDILSAMAVIMTQSQSDHHDEAMEFVEAAYKSTHSYTTSETPLYQCPDGCEITYYKCYDWIKNYDGTDMMYHPWTYQEIVKPTSSQECVVCKQEGLPYEEYAGCTVTKKCYHGDRVEGETLSTKADDYANYFEFDEDDSDDASEYYTEYIKPSIVNQYSTKYPNGYNKHGVRRWVTKADIIAASGLDPQCDNYKIITVNSWEEYTNSKGHERVHSEPCGYVAVCEGHDHYGCPDGHYVKTCFGHTDLYMNVYIASLNKIFEMGGVPITEDAGTALDHQVYGMDEEEFEKLSPEEQAKVIEKYNKKLEQAEGGGS